MMREVQSAALDQVRRDTTHNPIPPLACFVPYQVGHVSATLISASIRRVFVVTGCTCVSLVDGGEGEESEGEVSGAFDSNSIRRLDGTLTLEREGDSPTPRV